MAGEPTKKTLADSMAHWALGIVAFACTSMLAWVANTSSSTATQTAVIVSELKTLSSAQSDLKTEMRTASMTFTTKDQVEQALALVKKDLSIQASTVEHLSQKVEQLQAKVEELH